MEKLILVLTENRNLGLIIVPYFINESDDTPSINLSEMVDTDILDKYDYSFSEAEKKLLTIMHKLSDKYLFKIYSKDKSVKLFYEKLDTQKFNNVIRPHIEKYMMKVFDILADIPHIPLYFKDSKYSNIYKSDRIEMYDSISEPVFYFTLNKEGIDYTLKLKLRDKDLGMNHKNPTIITHDPCCLLIRNVLYRVKNTDSKKFLPFFDKDCIKIPARSIPTYMETFVQNAIKNHHVVNEGFEIREDKTAPVPLLHIEQNIQQSPVIVVKFKYKHNEYLSSHISDSAVQLSLENNKYTFTKYKRDKVKEAGYINTLESMGLKLESGANYIPEDTESYSGSANIFKWINQNYNDLIKEGFNLKQNSLEKRYYLGDYSCELITNKKMDWFDIHMVVQVGDYKVPFAKLRRHIMKDDNEYILPDNSVFVIPEDWFAMYQEMLTFSVEKNGKIVLPHMYHHLINRNNKDQKEENVVNYSGNNPPASLKAELRPYQLQGFKWMHYLHENNLGGILADDMGLGKTLQTISLILKVYEDHELQQDLPKNTESQLSLFETSDIKGYNNTGIPSSLIAMPTSLIHNWKNEFKKFAPSLKIYVYSGSKRLRSKDIGNIFKHYHVVLTSYGVLRNDVDFLQLYPFYYFILDESQYIKNPRSKIYEAIQQINCSKKIALTGTPIENSLSDLWAQMNFVNIGLLGNLNFFKRQYLIPIEKNNDEKKEEKLQRLIQPYVLRRTKDKVAKDLPPIIEQVMYCDMTDEQAKEYNAEKSGIRNEIMKNFEELGVQKSTFMALKALTKLRQIANHPIFINPDYEGESGKFNTIIEKLDSIIQEDHKVLIFSSFVKDLQLIEKDLKKKKIQYSLLTGSTTNRQEVVKNFEQNNKCKVFLISLKAGGVGLNLISADYVFLLNPWWNPAAEAQAINRAHRIGQTQNVVVYRFISTKTIEEKIMRLQDHKSKLADTFINSNNPFKNMNEKEIKKLFS